MKGKKKSYGIMKRKISGSNGSSTQEREGGREKEGSEREGGNFFTVTLWRED